MSQINKITVLQSFIERASISEEDIQMGKIFANMEHRTPRYMLFHSFVEELETDGILQQHRDIPKLWWTLNDKEEAIKFRDKLIKNQEPISHTYIETQNTTGDIYGGTVIQSGRESRFENFSNAAPITMPAKTDTNIKKKTFWSKSILFIWDNLWKFIIGILVAYATFRFGWKK